MSIASENNPPIDQSLNDDASYSVVFTHNMEPDCCDDCLDAQCFLDDLSDDGPITHSYPAHGVAGVLEALAQVLVVIDEHDLGTEDPVFVQEKLDHFIQRQAEAPGELAKIRAAIDDLDIEIQDAVGTEAGDVRDKALSKRSLLRRREAMLSDFIEAKNIHFLVAQSHADFANKIAEIIRSIRSGTLDLDAPMGEGEDRCGWGWVPAYEPRRTLGALIYYYVKHLADTETTQLEIKTLQVS